MGSRRAPRVLAALASIILLTATAECSAGPAPPLTSYRVTDVLSSGYPYAWDVIPAGAVSTPNDHSGPYLYVVVAEQGYAYTTSRMAQFNGQPMTIYQVQPVIGANRTITGYLVIYAIAPVHQRHLHEPGDLDGLANPHLLHPPVHSVSRVAYRNLPLSSPGPVHGPGRFIPSA